MQDTLDLVAPHCLILTPVGSRVTCNPPPVDTDADFLALVEDMEAFREALFKFEFVMDGSELLDAAQPPDVADRFSSYSFGEINIIATCDAAFHRKFLAASSVAKRLNLLNKEDRIALFQAVLYGNECEIAVV